MAAKKKIKKRRKWYSTGLHFECIGCGQCCSGPEEGYVWIVKPEIELLAKELGIGIEEVHEKHVRLIVKRYSLIEKSPSKDCIFLTNTESGKGCEVYSVRPNQCRTWPFWSMNLHVKDMWEIASASCPGMNRGKFYSFEEIENLRKQNKWWE